MKLSLKFSLFILAIHAVALSLSFLIFEKNKLYFIASEFLILASLFVSWSLYVEMIQPMKLLIRGIDAIRDRDFNVKFVKTGKVEVDKLIEVYNQMIDQLRQERLLQQEQHYFLEKLVKTSPTGIILLDYDQHIATINPRALALTALEGRNWNGRPLSDFDHPVLEAILKLEPGQSTSLTLPDMHTYKIQKAQFIDRGFPCTFVMIEELTLEILQAEKRSYGKVIRMMAHEVNNSIGAVNSILDTTLQLQADTSDLKPALQVAIERNEHLSRFMRNFADVIRLPVPHQELTDLHQLLRKVVQLMAYKAQAAGVGLTLDLAEAEFPVHIDISQMEQVFINVIKNAIEASPAGSVVCIRTREKPRQVAVIDQGVGISPELADKIFTPFFSNKDGGQGIGLTLSREILTAHGWGFSLRTKADGLTYFDMRP